MSNHIEALFEGQELSDEFKVKATAIIEAAIQESKDEFESQLKLQLEADFQDRVSELELEVDRYVSEEVVPHIDKYLTATVNEWSKENKVALEESAKVELAESFLTGLVGIAESHNLNIPQGQFDKIEHLEIQISEMRDKLNDAVKQTVELQAENKEFVRSAIIQAATAELSEAQKEKIVTVGSKVEFVSESQFTEAVKSIVESYFPAEPRSSLNVVIKEDEVPQKQPLSESYASKIIHAALNK